VFRNVQIRSKLLAIVLVPLLALVVFATVQVVSSVQSRIEADRLNRATRFASSLTALVDALQRERAISRGYVASAKSANYGTMIAGRVLVDTALQSFQKNLRSLDTSGFSAQFRGDLQTASATLGDLTGLRSRMESQPLTSLQVAGYYGSQIDALLAVIGDIGAQQGSGSLGNNVDALVAAAKAKEAASQSQGLFSVLTAATFGPEEYQQFATLTGEEHAYLAQFRQAATPAQRDFFSATFTGPDIDRTDGMRQAALTARDVPAGIAPKDWFLACSAKVDLLHQVELRVASDVASASGAAGRRGRRADSHRAGGGRGAADQVHRRDRRLATAFNSVHRVAVRVATEQAALRKSIGDMFVNLARRSQSLIDRQLNLIEEADGLAQLRQEAGLAVGGQCHHLVLVGGAREAEVLGDVLVEQAERVGEPLGGQHLQAPASGLAGKVRGVLAAPVQHQHARVRVGRRQVGGGRVSDVVGDEAHAGRVEPRQGRPQELRGTPRVQRPQALPAVGGEVGPGRRGQVGIVGVGDRVQLVWPQPRLGQAPRRRPRRQLPGGERDGGLAVLAPREALLLGGGHGLAVDHQRGGRIMEHGVDPENPHGPPSPISWGSPEQRLCSGSPG
jgi:Nitrate and nitrite sensing